MQTPTPLPPEVPPPLPPHGVPDDQPGGAPPVIGYATQQPSNSDAVLSVVFGLLLIVPLVPGVLAIFFGRRGMRAARERGGGRHGLARAGFVLGVVNLVLTLILVAALPPTMMKARRQAMTVSCAANMRAIGTAAHMYAVENRGFWPPTLDHVTPFLTPARTPSVVSCPACGNDPTKKPVTVTATLSSHYFYVPPGPKVTSTRRAADAVLLYEPATNHGDGRINVLFCDGHVETVGGAAAATLVAELQAGQNPPPSRLKP